jgi:hypothetical protein
MATGVFAETMETIPGSSSLAKQPFLSHSPPWKEWLRN